MLNLIIPNIFINKNLDEINKLLEKENLRRGYTNKLCYINYDLEKLNDIWIGGYSDLVADSNRFTIYCYSNKLKQIINDKNIEYNNIQEKWNKYFETNKEYYEEGLLNFKNLNIKDYDMINKIFILNDNYTEKEKIMCDILNLHRKFERDIYDITKNYLKNKDNYKDIKCIFFKPDIEHNDIEFKYNIMIKYKKKDDNNNLIKCCKYFM